MALSGALADLGVVDLVQFPHAGRKSGELVVARGEQEARLYYEKGKLVHAALGDLRGPPALVQVLGWGEGRFEFRGEVAAPETSIEMDLHRAVMEALRRRDEQAEERRKKGPHDVGKVDDRLANLLAAFVSGNSWALHACVLAADGTLAAEASGKAGGSFPLEPLRAPLRALLGAWPRPGLRRALLEDDIGTVAVVRHPGGGALLVVAAKGVAVGVVWMNVGKLAASVEA